MDKAFITPQIEEVASLVLRMTYRDLVLLAELIETQRKGFTEEGNAIPRSTRAVTADDLLLFAESV
jgi:hypothetical protein